SSPRVAGIRAHGRTIGGRVRYPPGGGFTSRLLDRLFPLALEIPRGSDGGHADCAAANGSRILCTCRPRFPEPAGALVAVSDRTHFSVHLYRTGDRLHPL